MRLDAWRSALLMIRDHPLVGIGPGMWNRFISEYAGFYWNGPAEGSRIFVSGAHNLVLNQGAELGIAGLVGTVALAVVMFQQSIHLFRQEGQGPLAELALSFVALTLFLWIGTMAGGMSFGPVMLADGRYLLWMFLGVMAAWRKIQERPGPSVTPAGTH